MVDRRQVMRFRVRAQQLDRTAGTLGDTAALDIGVQDTGPDGAGWALAIRGVPASEWSGKDVVLLWTLRGAPHLYRRSDVGQVAAAVAPFSEADAGKRILNASIPLKAAGITNLAALDEVATRMRETVTRPTGKGEVSGRLAAVMPEPYLRYCRACQATHPYEMPFRLAALPAGLELQLGTSPPVLQRITGFRPAKTGSERFDVIRAYLRLLGPATPRDVAEYLDAPLPEVKRRWPEDVVEVTVDREKQKRWVLAADAPRIDAPTEAVTRLLGPYDLFLQARDRDTLVPDPARAKQLWPVLGRPGAVLVDGELVGVWRPRKVGNGLSVMVELWNPLPRRKQGTIVDQAERLAAHRGIPVKSVEIG
jgi:hypothetical protein